MGKNKTAAKYILNLMKLRMAILVIASVVLTYRMLVSKFIVLVLKHNNTSWTLPVLALVMGLELFLTYRWTYGKKNLYIHLGCEFFLLLAGSCAYLLAFSGTKEYLLLGVYAVYFFLPLLLIDYIPMLLILREKKEPLTDQVSSVIDDK
ncbi:MAG: hypothetical protein IJS80_05340 [Lachnospiraceae bacterium]|nr:hypothetical protein [Lachnospiraceae bacterium]